MQDKLNEIILLVNKAIEISYEHFDNQHANLAKGLSYVKLCEAKCWLGIVKEMENQNAQTKK